MLMGELPAVGQSHSLPCSGRQGRQSHRTPGRRGKVGGEAEGGLGVRLRKTGGEGVRRLGLRVREGLG